MLKPSRIEVWWDAQDPADAGWAWTAYGWRYGEEIEIDDGALPSRHRNTSDRRLAMLARREAGVAGDRAVTVEVRRVV